jgi:UDP-N-acetylglucosamine 2-epimerase (non-hydrolysing)
MLDQVLNLFHVVPDVDCNLMQPGQSLAALTARAISAIDDYLAAAQPAMIVVQGDTTTVLAASLCAFYRRIPVAHVEAGLRTRDRHSPFPEEINRVLTSRMSDLHFAPTAAARENLLREGIPADHIHVTGNTVIDALHIAVERIRCEPPAVAGLPDFLQPELVRREQTRIVLVTGHRRENFGLGFDNICAAIGDVAFQFPDVHFVYPVHLNPNVMAPVNRILAGFTNVHLIAPLGYLPFVALMDAATLVLTDSGGVQEEAPSLGKPVLVMRDTTERPEAVAAGTARLVGTDRASIVGGLTELLTNDDVYQAMARAVNPYGDGQACVRIARVLEDYLAH